MVIVGLFFMMSFQPIFMVSMLIIITLMYSLYIYFLMGSYWFSYALIMVMLSGVLVVFTYLMSLFPNESFEIYNLIYIVVFMILFMSYDLMSYGFDYSVVSLNLWLSYIGLFNLFLVGFLLSIMLMAVWVSGIKEGAVKVM